MACASHFQAWVMLREDYAHNRACTHNLVLKWATKKLFLKFVCFSWAVLETSFSCSRLTLALFHWYHWHYFWFTVLFQVFLKVVFLCYKMSLHMALAGILLGMWREEVARNRDCTINPVLDVVPHKFMLTQCRDCRAYCEALHHLFSASALL